MFYFRLLCRFSLVIFNVILIRLFSQVVATPFVFFLVCFYCLFTVVFCLYFQFNRRNKYASKLPSLNCNPLKRLTTRSANCLWQSWGATPQPDSSRRQGHPSLEVRHGFGMHPVPEAIPNQIGQWPRTTFLKSNYRIVQLSNGTPPKASMVSPNKCLSG